MLVGGENSSTTFHLQDPIPSPVHPRCPTLIWCCKIEDDQAQVQKTSPWTFSKIVSLHNLKEDVFTKSILFLLLLSMKRSTVNHNNYNCMENIIHINLQPNNLRDWKGEFLQ